LRHRKLPPAIPRPDHNVCAAVQPELLQPESRSRPVSLHRNYQTVLVLRLPARLLLRQPDYPSTSRLQRLRLRKSEWFLRRRTAARRSKLVQPSVPAQASTTAPPNNLLLESPGASLRIRWLECK